MLGDSLSDAHHALREAVTEHYPDEFGRLPLEIQKATIEAIGRLDRVRVEIDAAQVPLSLVPGTGVTDGSNVFQLRP